MIKRILFSESSPNLGGQELQLLQQMRALAERGIMTHLLCRPTSKVAERARELGLPMTAVRFRNSLHLPSIWRVRRFLAGWHPDAIICHSGHDTNVCALAARTVRNRPVLLRSRTYQPGVPGAFTYNHLVDLTMVPSAALRRQILVNPRIDPERIRVAYPGIDFEAIKAAETASLPTELASWLESHPGPLVVLVAMMRGEKGHLFLLDVISQLRAQVPNIRCVMAGDGELLPAVAARIRELELTEHVHLAGMVKQVAPLMRRADVVVVPSTMEPLGMTQIEALALGVPVVANRVGGVPETIEDGVTGWLVPVGDVIAWHTALAEVLSNPQRAHRQADVGRAKVMARFAITESTDRILALVAQARAAR